jgi:hypothetical protein
MRINQEKIVCCVPMIWDDTCIKKCMWRIIYRDEDGRLMEGYIDGDELGGMNNIAVALGSLCELAIATISELIDENRNRCECGRMAFVNRDSSRGNSWRWEVECECGRATGSFKNKDEALKAWRSFGGGMRIVDILGEG